MYHHMVSARNNHKWIFTKLYGSIYNHHRKYIYKQSKTFFDSSTNYYCIRFHLKCEHWLNAIKSTHFLVWIVSNILNKNTFLFLGNMHLLSLAKFNILFASYVIVKENKELRLKKSWEKLLKNWNKELCRHL